VNAVLGVGSLAAYGHAAAGDHRDISLFSAIARTGALALATGRTAIAVRRDRFFAME